MKSILDRSFRYTPSGQTDLKKTFAHFRRELRKWDFLTDWLYWLACGAFVLILLWRV